jgi:hypothetical protein
MVSTNNSASIKGRTKPARSVDRGSAAATNASSSTTSLSSSARTTQLSGVTRNMRFMQRGKNNNINNNKARHSFPQTKQKIKMDETTESNVAANTFTGAIEISTHSENIASQKMELTLKHDNNNDKATIKTDIKWEKATPLDMYGQNQWLVLGRRSFNGFNPITASNWFTQQQYLDREDQRIKGTGITQNERRRYKELTKLVQNEDRNELSNKRGKKDGKSSISNQKKRGLDDILKLVDM